MAARVHDPRVLGRGTFACVALALLGVAGCRPKMPVTMEPDRLVHRHYSYEIPYLGSAASEILGPDWMIDNYRLEPGVRHVENRWVHKRDPEFVTTRAFDVDGDGRFDIKRYKEPIYDLRLTHRITDGVIFLGTTPVSAEEDKKLLSVLAQRMVDSASSTGVFLTVEPSGEVRVAERRFGTTLRESRDCLVGGRPAHLVSFEMTDVNRAQAGDGLATRKVELVVVDAGFREEVKLNDTAASFRVLLVAGISNRPDLFEQTLPDFGGLLDRIRVDGQPAVVNTCVRAGVGSEEPSSTGETSPAETSDPGAEDAPSAASEQDEPAPDEAATPSSQ